MTVGIGPPDVIAQAPAKLQLAGLGRSLPDKSIYTYHCEQSAQWCIEVQRSFAREVQWAVRNLGNSRLVIQKLDVKSDNFT